MLRMTLEDEFGVYEIEINDASSHISQHVDIFRRLLASASFTQNTIDEFVPDVEVELI